MYIYVYIYIIYIYIYIYIPLYIDAFSNHPPTSIKQLPKMISKKILDLSCTKEKFDKVKSVYESALKDSGHFSSMF